MGPPAVLKEHPILTNEAGFLSVDSETLRHTKYSNIFGLGDCTNTPNSKTMAAIGKIALSSNSIPSFSLQKYINHVCD